MLIFVFFSLYYDVKHHIYSQGNETLINCCLLTFRSASVYQPEVAEAMLFMWLSRQTSLKKFGKTFARKSEFKKSKNMI